MSGIQPFRGLVVNQAAVHDVVSPAYDALTAKQRQAHRADHPNCYLHVTRSAEDEPDADTVDNATLVARGRAALEQIIAQNLFVSHGDPALFVYRLARGDHAQSGLVCEAPSPYFASVARPHEATRPERAALLAEHFAVVKAASSPIACAVADDGELEALLAAASTGVPVLDFASDDGLEQTVWRVEDAQLEAQLIERLEGQDLFIIDGHHRSAANTHLRERGISVPLLLTVFPERALRLVGFHRMLRLPVGLSGAQLMHEIGRRFRVQMTAEVEAVEDGSVAMVVNGQWHVVYFDERPVAGGAQVLLGSLDPVVLEREVLQSLVGRYGPVDVTYVPDVEPFAEIVAAAERDERIPMMVPPVAIGDMMAVAKGGVIMPAKSTYFVPKVRSGLFLRELDEIDNS